MEIIFKDKLKRIKVNMSRWSPPFKEDFNERQCGCFNTFYFLCEIHLSIDVILDSLKKGGDKMLPYFLTKVKYGYK